MACSWSLSAQTRTYHGTVLDAANDEPLIGATVMPIGGGQGVATDADGKFTLTVPAKVKTVKVTYVGYKEQSVSLQNNMTVYLQSTSTSLDDVVVVAYGTANKESLTGSVAVVGSKEIEDRPVTSVTTALEGNAPGVQVNNSTGYPGSAPSIRIRGFNSINGSNDPLYVVDGVVYNGTIADLNPADVESISVLKDAASSALYGNRGANGVILITTKKAKNVGKVDVSLQIRQGMYNRALPFYNTLGADKWMETSLMAYGNGLVSSGAYPTEEAAFADARKSFIEGYALKNIYDKADDQLFDGNNRLVASMLPGYADDRDWWDAISQNGHRQEYNINAAGATEKFNIFASVGYVKENGYVIKSDFERFSGRLNANFNPTSYLRFGVNLNASHQVSQLSQADGDNLNVTNNPFNVIYKSPIFPVHMHNADGSMMLDDNGDPVYSIEKYNRGDNVAWSMRLDDSKFTSTVADGSIFGTVVLPYGFEATVRGSIYRRQYSGKDYSNNVVGSQVNVGGLDETFYVQGTHTFMQQLNWAHDYGMHHVDVLLDHENYQYSYNDSFIRKAGQILPGIIALSNFDDTSYTSEGITKCRTESYLGRARYNYDQKYFGEVSVRRDGTSRLAPDYRWGTFWSVGASWIITKEKFMHGIDWVNYLKLRAAYGSVGNDASAGSYAYWALYGLGQLDQNKVLFPTQLAASKLKWEATSTFDIALEGSLFDDRFNFSIGYFNKRNTDLMFSVVQALSAGSVGAVGSLGYNPSIQENIGTMENTGWELQFGVDIIRNADIKWSFNVDGTFLKNKIVKLPGGHDLASQTLFLGKSRYEHYRYKWAGVDQLTGQSLYEMAPDSPDYTVYDDVTGEASYDTAAWERNLNNARADGSLVEINGKYYTTKTSYAKRVLCGTALPTLYGSFGTNFSWKGINVGLLFTYSLGGKTYDSNYASLMSIGTDNPQAIHNDILNAWTGAPEGMTEDSPNRIDPNGVPQLNSQLSQFNNAGSSRFLTSSDYLTFKNLNVSYDFPSKWVRAMKMQNLNIGVSIDNLFIVAARKGMNPQYGFGGGQGPYYVPSRVFSFQLGVKF